MDFRVQIRKLLAERNLTEWQLAERLGMHRGAIVQMLANQRQPGTMECLLLAGFFDEGDDRQYWLNLSGISETQRTLLSRVFGNPVLDLSELPPEMGRDVAVFLDFIVNAHVERRRAVQAVLRAWRDEQE